MHRPDATRTQRDKWTEIGALFGFAAFLALPWAIVSCGTEATTATANTGTTGSANNANATSSTTTGNVANSGTSDCAVQPAPTCADPNAAPSYQKTVSGIIYSYCLECHDPNGIANISGSSHPFTPPPGGFGGDPNMMGNANDANRPHPMGDANHMGNANTANWDPRAQYDWSNYPNIRRHAQDMITVLRTCVMPPSTGTDLDSADRTTLLQWLACGAPDN